MDFFLPMKFKMKKQIILSGFAEDVKCPLITYMDLGWSIALEKIE